MTDELPKALVSLNGKPILQHLIEAYIQKGVHRFVLCIGYQGERIREFISSHPFDAEFEFSEAGENASMLQRLYHARSSITDRAFVAYGDTLIDMDLEAMLNDHRSSAAWLTMTVADVKSPFGLVTADEDGWVQSFREKPIQSYFVGHMLLERTVLDGLESELLDLGDGQGLVKLFDRLIDQKCLRLYSYNGPQITFNTSQELDQAERDLITFFTQREETHGTAGEASPSHRG
jgi:NDP-sugar pyrophosphorylase family protein